MEAYCLRSLQPEGRLRPGRLESAAASAIAVANPGLPAEVLAKAGCVGVER